VRKGRRFSMQCLVAALAVIAAYAALASAQHNLLVDGGFESPPFTGGFVTVGAGAKFGAWTVGTGTIDRLNSPRWRSYDGGRSVDLNGGGPGSVYQDIATVAGTTYTLEFAMAGNPEGDKGVKRMSVRWGGTEVARRSFNTQGHTNTSMGWGLHRYTVRASAAKTRLEFVSVSTPGFFGPAVDHVSIAVGGGSEPPPPVAGKSVVADVVSGVVFIQVPSGKSIKRGKGKSSRAYAAKFKRYKGKANIPVGSLIDTRKGRIAIQSASDLKGGTQDGQFYDGIFQIKQARAAKPVTDALLITSRAGCGKSSARASAKKKLGRLWATAKGKFRTKGRYSAASVRGTTWLTEDRCDGTFTKVSRGRVSVRDNVKRKTIILSAGESYLARAQRASSK
jgi:choice-of-anchor C domain-containing protein